MKLLFRKLLLAPFYLLIVALDAVGRVIRLLLPSRHTPKRKSAFGPGISVVIPERANKEMLRRCLESLRTACASIGEPVQVVVVVSGAERGMYEDLTEEFQAHWILQSKPLWFIEAVALGVHAAKYDWVYLLNTDMVLDPGALREIAKWRSPSVFAIASQIYFQDSTRRREETGLTAIRDVGGLLEILDVEPDDDYRIRTHVYAGGGSSLFRRRLLQSFIDRTRGYAPFYWEDVEWGVLAWRNGFEVLFCPQSKAWHAHRSTNLKFFSPEEIDRIVGRNRLRFQLRTGLPPNVLRTVFGSIARLDARSFREMLNASCVVETLRSRFRCYFDPPFSLQSLPGLGVRYCRPRRPGAPLVLIASPYCVYPPAHGGARRMHELIERLSQDFDIILLSDESEHYSNASFKYFEKCHLVSLISGRQASADPYGRIARIITHSHPVLAAQLRALILMYDPDIVQIEYVELAKLVEMRDRRPWILTLHDVLLEEGGAMARKEDEFELQYINRFDAVIVCGAEDRALLRRNNVHIVQNGANVTTRYTPSPADAPILFLGPFRYPPNLAGIIEFLNDVYPSVRAKVRAARLYILGGDDARLIAARSACFDQPGVTVFDFIEDVHPYLEGCSISINPDRSVRGSSLKVIESLAAGRVCVTTRDGARGLMGANLPSLVVVNENEFADRIVRLLTDIEYRHRLEVPTEALHQYSWEQASQEQARIYTSLLETGCSIRTYAFARAGTQAQ
ncbi:MAG TPA: glycosyltransferase [Terriglobia bacterium]|nr:glycosyltransferase [Terriglobia bacterium]